MAQIVLPVSAMSRRADAGALPEKRLSNGWLTAWFAIASRLLDDGRLLRHGDLVTPRQLGNDELVIDILRVAALLGVAPVRKKVDSSRPDSE